MSVLPVQNPIANPADPMDNIYVTSDNLKVSASRVMSDTCYEQAFNTTILGSSNVTFTVPADRLLSNCYARFVWNANTFPNAAATPYLPDGWGYLMIRRIRFQFQNSQILEIDGRSNFIEAVRQCENSHKRSQLITLGGKAMPSGNVGNLLEAVVHINLPFSTMNANENGYKVPFDSSVLSGPVVVRLDFACAGDIFTGGNAATYPTFFSSGSFGIQQYNMVDMDDSVRELVSSRGLDQYIYPYIYPQHFISPKALVAVAPNAECASNKMVETLNGFQSGTLIGLVLYLEEIIAGTEGHNKQKYVEMSNVEVKFAGQCVYKAEGNAGKYWCLSQLEDSCDAPVVAPSPGATSPPYAPAVGTTSYYTEVWFSQYAVKSLYNLMQSGANLSNNVLTVTFNSPEGSTGKSYKLHADYLYQAGVRVARGNAQLIFQSLSALP